VADEIAIMEQEREPIERDGLRLTVPEFMKQIVAEITLERVVRTEMSVPGT
jgi:hypothetical protein